MGFSPKLAMKVNQQLSKINARTIDNRNETKRAREKSKLQPIYFTKKKKIILSKSNLTLVAPMLNGIIELNIRCISRRSCHFIYIIYIYTYIGLDSYGERNS